MKVEQLTKAQKRYLSRRNCAWCDYRLDWSGCGAIYERCPVEVQEKRRAECLNLYKPRKH